MINDSSLHFHLKDFKILCKEENYSFQYLLFILFQPASFNEISHLLNFLVHFIKLTLKCLVRGNLAKEKLNIVFINIHLVEETMVDLPIDSPECVVELQRKSRKLIRG